MNRSALITLLGFAGIATMVAPMPLPPVVNPYSSAPTPRQAPLPEPPADRPLTRAERRRKQFGRK